MVSHDYSCGIFMWCSFLAICDHLLPHEHMISGEIEGVHSHFSKNQLFLLAMTLHNIPEGLAVGVAFAVASAISSCSDSLFRHWYSEFS